ncbi:MAG: hypothetical protein H6703_10570 [Myxococcales bacterium]|nr:hypothetical protein [Myxococcales bacterium]MCB9553719.1 hypothetical protein [Myxococcales bacterium]
MRALLPVTVSFALAGCMRTGSLPTAELDCGAGGGLVVIEGSALCVYVEAPPERCPDALPNRFDRDAGTVCARQTRPEPGLVERALARVLAGDAGVQPADGGLSIVDSGGADGGDF